MNDNRYCKQCGKGFTSKRPDHFFCRAACVAKFYRENPNPEFIHAQKAEIHTHYCEQCGVPFQVNDYAQRGGKRQPKYCSGACKQRAYRERGTQAQPQAKRRYESQPPPPPKTEHKKTRFETNAPPGETTPKPPPESQSRTFWDGYSSKKTAACLWLNLNGTQFYFSKTELRNAWKEAMKKVHPDISKDPDATWKAQATNWAYKYLLKGYST